MQNTQQLKERVQDRHRAARDLLASKGARQWSTAEQTAFDSLLDDSERTQAQLDALGLRQHHSSSLRAAQHAGLDLFIRKAPLDRSLRDAEVIRNTLSTTTPNQGGYNVGTLVAADFVNRLSSYGWMRQVSTQYTTTKGGPGSLVA